MEPEIRSFLIRIVKSLSMGLLWMFINLLFGVKWGLLFLDGKVSIWNYVYYGWLVISFIGLIWYIKKVWKDAPDFDLEDVYRPEEKE